MKNDFSYEPELPKRIAAQSKLFAKYYGNPHEIISRAPGRAEILGNHTDYNSGFALSCAISRSTISLLSKRSDDKIIMRSTAFPSDILEFNIRKIKRNKQKTWTNYPMAVVKYLLKNNYKIGGANILVDSNVPKCGGVSSSAAFELCIGNGLLNLYRQKIKTNDLALLCKLAENSDIVQSPCGFLDQGSVAFGKKDKMVFMDFLPKGNSPVSSVRLIDANIEKYKSSFIIIVDPTLERQLGESGYVERRKMCEDSLSFWTRVLKRKINSLREVKVTEFEKYKKDLEKFNHIMRMRVEHVVYENGRVLEAVKTLIKGDIKRFGELLNQAGKSALELYELDENTPQLTFLVNKGRNLPGVLGIRNMGGGFSAITLALVKNSHVKKFEKSISELYKNRFKRKLDFIEFKLTNGAEIIR